MINETLNSLDYRIDEQAQSVSELWISISDLATGRVKDNISTGSYPLAIREMQLITLENLVGALRNAHIKMKAPNADVTRS